MHRNERIYSLPASLANYYTSVAMCTYPICLRASVVSAKSKLMLRFSNSIMPSTCLGDLHLWFDVMCFFRCGSGGLIHGNNTTETWTTQQKILSTVGYSSGARFVRPTSKKKPCLYTTLSDIKMFKIIDCCLLNVRYGQWYGSWF